MNTNARMRTLAVKATLLSLLVFATPTIAALQQQMPMLQLKHSADATKQAPVAAPDSSLMPAPTTAPISVQKLSYYDERSHLAYFKDLRELIGLLHRLDLLAQHVYAKPDVDKGDFEKDKKELSSSIDEQLKSLQMKSEVLTKFSNEHKELQKAVSFDLNNLLRLESAIKHMVSLREELFKAANEGHGDFADRLGVNVINRAQLFLDINTSELEGALDMNALPKDSVQSYRIESIALNNTLTINEMKIAQANLKKYLGDAVPESELDLSKLKKQADELEALLNQSKQSLSKASKETEKSKIYQKILDNESQILDVNRNFTKRLSGLSGKVAVRGWFDDYSRALKSLWDKRKLLDQEVNVEEGGDNTTQINQNAEQDLKEKTSSTPAKSDTENLDEFFKH